jgi:hypothetical protein
VWSSLGGDVALLEQFQKVQCNGEKPILLVDKAWKRNICHMFAPGYTCVNIDIPIYTYDALKLTDGDGITIFSLFPTTHYLRQDDLIREGKAHYFECIAKDLGVKVAPVYLPSKWKGAALNATRKYKLNLTKFVIVCPEASTASAIPNSEWVKVIDVIKSLGYDVYLNVTKQHKEFKNEKQFFLKHYELMELAKCAQLIVGIRSGLMEILAVTQVPMIAVYPEIPDRIELKGVKALLNGFTMKKIPGLNLKNNVFEYVDTTPVETIIQNVREVLNSEVNG